jgi:mannose-6-phosphate isomerase-like protein (cupin superfamily)
MISDTFTGFGIQMHYHDIEEEFAVKYGTIDAHFGDDFQAIHAPKHLTIPKNQDHALFANSEHGFLLQETIAVDSFAKRSVVFV